MNTDTNGFRYYNDLDEAKADGYSPVKATSSLCFFQLKGRTDTELLKKVKQESLDLYKEKESIVNANGKPLLSKDSATALIRAKHGLYKTENSPDLAASNLEPITDLPYCVLAKSDNKYYVKESRGYDLDSLFFYRRSLTFSGEDTAIENLRRYIEDNNVWILYTPSQVESVAKTLLRLYTSKLSGEGKLSYPIYIKLLYESLMYEDYKGYGSSLSGYKTVCKGYEDRIDALWKYAYEQCQKKPVQ